LLRGIYRCVAADRDLNDEPIEISAQEETLLAGMAEEKSIGSIGELVDMEALKGYRDPLLEID
jgi:hypothetical protein